MAAIGFEIVAVINLAEKAVRYSTFFNTAVNRDCHSLFIGSHSTRTPWDHTAGNVQMVGSFTLAGIQLLTISPSRS